jgi:hypothetical protein
MQRVRKGLIKPFARAEAADAAVVTTSGVIEPLRSS